MSKETSGSLTAFARSYLEQHRISTTKAGTDAGIHVKFTWSALHGASYLTMVGTADTLDKGALIATAALADRGKWKRIVVTPTPDDARWVSNVLQMPYRQSADGWAKINKIPNRYWTADNAITVIPRSRPVGTWQINPAGDCRYVTDGTVAAQGHISNLLNTYSTGLPKCIINENNMSIVHRGETLHTTRNRSTLAEHYRPINLPSLPTRVHYAGNTNVYYRSDQTLVPYHPAPEWTELIAGSREEQATNAFISSYTTSEPGQTISLSAACDRLRQWYRNKSLAPLPSSRAFAEVMSRTSVDVEVRKQKLVDRAWAVPMDHSLPMYEHVSGSLSDEPSDKLARDIARQGVSR